jgi:hypothetical protein
MTEQNGKSYDDEVDEVDDIYVQQQIIQQYGLPKLILLLLVHITLIDILIDQYNLINMIHQQKKYVLVLFIYSQQTIDHRYHLHDADRRIKLHFSEKPINEQKIQPSLIY